MKKIVTMLVCGIVVVACTGEDIPEDEDVGTVSDAITYYGYCDVSSTGALTGKCRGCSSMCAAKLDSECSAGAAPIDPVAFPGVCGVVRFDRQRRCTANLTC